MGLSKPIIIASSEIDISNLATKSDVEGISVNPRYNNFMGGDIKKEETTITGEGIISFLYSITDTYLWVTIDNKGIGVGVPIKSGCSVSFHFKEKVTFSNDGQENSARYFCQTV